MKEKKYTIRGKDGKYYAHNQWVNEEDLNINRLYCYITNASDEIIRAKERASRESDTYEKREAKKFLDKRPCIEEVIVDMIFLEH